MRKLGSGIFVIVVSLLVSCNSGSNPKLVETNTGEALAHVVIAREVIQTSAYTYMYVESGNNNYWIAVNKMEAKEGEPYYYEDAYLMTNFESKELERMFDTIYFVQEIRDKPKRDKANIPNEDVRMERPKVVQMEISVEPAEGGVTIVELYSKRNSYNGTVVKIRGEVVKFNPEIMGINWVHIQDGTNDNGKFDLTITTHDKVSLGDVVTFEGRIAVDKDFGAGYTYDVIMEDAIQPDLEY